MAVTNNLTIHVFYDTLQEEICGLDSTTKQRRQLSLTSVKTRNKSSN